jgi:SanA protein
MAALTLITVGCNWWLIQAHDRHIYLELAKVPPRDVALVLGTSPGSLKNRNAFFEARMSTAERLWKEGKVRHFLVSGDNGSREYDEPTAMQNALVARGVPATAITCDYAGFRTLDSMVRARRVFGLGKVTIVTDDWHLPRALFLADAAGMDAVGVCLVQVPWNASARTRVREWFSSVNAIADVYLFGTEPKFLGDPVAIPVASPISHACSQE